VYWPYTSGCDVVEKFEVNIDANIIWVKAFGYYNNMVCTKDVGIKTKNFSIIPSSKGIFKIRFVNKDNSYIYHTLSVY
jgi:hypothetical protein